MMWRVFHRRWGRAALGGLLLLAAATGARADGPLFSDAFWEDTALVSVTVGGPRADYVASFARGGYELSDGTPIRMRQWYRAGLRDLNLTLLTSITPDFGVMWGMGLGDRGAKYRIEPSLRLGLIWQTRVGRDSWLALRATTDLGGRIREHPCTADFGDLGGVQPVNCRLAASPLPPDRTLDLLFDEKLRGNTEIGITLTVNF